MLNDILKAVRDLLKALPLLATLGSRLDKIDADLEFIKGQLKLITGDPGEAESPIGVAALVDRIEEFAERYRAQTERITTIGKIHN